MTSPLANDMRVCLSVRTVAFLSDRVLTLLGGFQQFDQRHPTGVLSGDLRVSIRFHGVQEGQVAAASGRGLDRAS